MVFESKYMTHTHKIIHILRSTPTWRWSEAVIVFVQLIICHHGRCKHLCTWIQQCCKDDCPSRRSTLVEMHCFNCSIAEWQLLAAFELLCLISCCMSTMSDKNAAEELTNCVFSSTGVKKSRSSANNPFSSCSKRKSSRPLLRSTWSIASMLSSMLSIMCRAEFHRVTTDFFRVLCLCVLVSCTVSFTQSTSFNGVRTVQDYKLQLTTQSPACTRAEIFSLSESEKKISLASTWTNSRSLSLVGLHLL